MAKQSKDGLFPISRSCFARVAAVEKPLSPIGLFGSARTIPVLAKVQT